MRSGGAGITVYKLSTSKTCTALRAYVSIQNNCKLFNDFNSTRAVIKVIIYTLLYFPLTLRLSLILWGPVNLLFIFIPPGCGDVNKHSFIYSRKCYLLAQIMQLQLYEMKKINIWKDLSHFNF